MKTEIHPQYRAVVFRDLASGDTFLTRSTVSSDSRNASTSSASGPSATAIPISIPRMAPPSPIGVSGSPRIGPACE